MSINFVHVLIGIQKRPHRTLAPRRLGRGGSSGATTTQPAEAASVGERSAVVVTARERGNGVLGRVHGDCGGRAGECTMTATAPERAASSGGSCGHWAEIAGRADVGGGRGRGSSARPPPSQKRAWRWMMPEGDAGGSVAPRADRVELRHRAGRPGREPPLRLTRWPPWAKQAAAYHLVQFSIKRSAD